jgi:hypothetical protein
MKQRNLFLSTMRLVNSKENHLTEFLAAALASDPVFRGAYASLVLRDFAAKNGWTAPEITEVKTQDSFKGSSCCPDLVLELCDGHVIACEHKIEAPETAGEDSSDRSPVGNLERYLELPEVQGVAYFRSSWSSPASAVLTHPKYIKPQDREHFLWRDLYEPLKGALAVPARWICEGFEDLGYTPPHREIGDLLDPDEAKQIDNQNNLGKLWNSTQSKLSALGWKVDSGRRCELYLRTNPVSAAKEIYISPLRKSGRFLLLRVTPRSESTIQQIEARLRQAALKTQHPIEIVSSLTRRTKGCRAVVVDVAVSLTELLRENLTVDEIERTLLGYVLPLVQAIDGGAADGAPRVVGVGVS